MLDDGTPPEDYVPIGRPDSRYGWTPQHDVVMKVAIEPGHTLYKGYQSKERSRAFATHPTHRDPDQMLEDSMEALSRAMQLQQWCYEEAQDVAYTRSGYRCYPVLWRDGLAHH